MFDNVDISPVLKFQDMIDQTAFMTEFFITHPKIQTLLKSKQNFDLIISELAFNEALLGNVKLLIALNFYQLNLNLRFSSGFSEHYKCPHILISTVGATSWIGTVTGNPSPSSYIPHVLLELTDKMTLLERLQNTLFNLAEDVLLNLFHYPRQQDIYENAFPDSKSFRPFWDKIKHGVSLVS